MPENPDSWEDPQVPSIESPRKEEPKLEQLDFALPDFPELPEFDYRPEDHWGGEEESPNAHLLAMADRYLEETRTKKAVREHIPLLLILAGIQIADRRNQAAPVHFYGPDIPFRYVTHLTQLGASGTDKGSTVETFFRIVGRANDSVQPLFSTDEFKGGSLESLRGGTAQLGGRRFFQLGGIERAYDGFIYVPEFTQLADLSERSGGAIQSIIAWADTAGRMDYDTIAGGTARYHAPASLILGLQTSKLTDVENVVLGWNRRSIYDHYPTSWTEALLPSKRQQAIPGDTLGLDSVRSVLRSVMKNWRPTAIDWSLFHEWLEKAYVGHLAVAQDEQMLYSLALGFHIVTGGRLDGTVTVTVSDDLHRILERILWYKRLARVSLSVRTARDALYVLEDPYVLGTPSNLLDERNLIRIVAARLSVGEDLVKETLPILIERGFLVSIVEETPETGAKVRYRLSGR